MKTTSYAKAMAFVKKLTSRDAINKRSLFSFLDGLGINAPENE